MVVYDDFSRMIFAFLLKQKSDAAESLEQFIIFAKNQTGKNVKAIRSDNGTEYVNKRFNNFTKKLGIQHQTTVPGNSQSNGRAERANGILQEKARCMLADSHLDKKFWSEAIATAAYLSNRSPKCTLSGKTPYELWYGHKPNLSNLRIFGCRAYTHVPTKDLQKFDNKSADCVFVGYCTDYKTYKLWNTKKSKFILSRDVVFYEDLNPQSQESAVMLPLGNTQLPQADDSNNSSDSSDFEDACSEAIDKSLLSKSLNREVIDKINSDETCSQSEIQATPVRRSERTRRPSARFLDYNCAMITQEPDLTEPKTYKQALSCANAEDWQDAMESEYNSILSYDTWELVDRPNQANVINGCIN